MASSSIFRIPRPNTFLYLMSLRTGTELITLSVLVNKLSGLYGILALFTGIHLSPLQLSMYIYSIAALILTAYLAPHIRKQSPLQCLALAWFYLLDSLINAAYTAAFGMGWFMVLAQHNAAAPGSSTMDSAAGFVKPKFTVSRVAVVEGASTAAPTAAAGVRVAQDTHLIGQGDGAAAGAARPLSHAMLEPGSIASITIISALWMLRLYFILVVMAYARAVLRRHIVAASQASGLTYTPSAAPDAPDKGAPARSDFADNPFAHGTDAGAGWPGALGRFLLRVGGRRYWLGPDGEGEWARDLEGRFLSKAAGAGGAQPAGPFERERRRRAGTGPPMLRPIELKGVGKGASAGRG